MSRQHYPPAAEWLAAVRTRRTPRELALIDELARLPGISWRRLEALADAAGVPRHRHATEAELRAMLQRAHNGTGQ
jgi:Xaa-Pro aminopeptidase